MQSSTLRVELAEGTVTRNLPADDHLANPGRVVVERLADVPADSLVSAAQQVIDVVAKAFKPRPEGPESCVVKFGLKISAEGNLVVAKVGSELNLEVTVTWKR